MDTGSSGLLGRLALHYKLLTASQVAEATQLQSAQPHLKLGEVLVQQGWLTQKQLAWLMQVQEQVLAKQRQKQAAPATTAATPARPPATTPLTVPTPTPKRTSIPLTVPGPAPTSRPAPAAVSSELPPPQVESVPVESRVPLPVASPAPASRSVSTASGVKWLDALIIDMIAAGASDLQLHPGAPALFRCHGQLSPQGPEPLVAEAIGLAIRTLLTPDQQNAYQKHGELDFAFDRGEQGRFRANAYRSLRGEDLCLRRIAPAPPTLEELGLPSSLAKFTTYPQGMVLVTGPAGCGKSSTMAALVRLINEEREEHILTVEDPIEYVHVSAAALVNHRQVQSHTESFARALKAALREDPDVIVLGELRDLETISLALTAAETGHLVLATMSTTSSIRTIERLVGVFPPDQQSQVRSMVSESLRGVVTQRLVRRKDDVGRVPAVEILVVNRAIANLIREEKTFQIQSALQTGASHGMRLMDDALGELVRSGTVDSDEARRVAEDPKRIPN